MTDTQILYQLTELLRPVSCGSVEFPLGSTKVLRKSRLSFDDSFIDLVIFLLEKTFIDDSWMIHEP